MRISVCDEGKVFQKENCALTYCLMELFFWKTWENIFRPIKHVLCVSFTIFAKKRKNGKLKTKENNS